MVSLIRNWETIVEQLDETTGSNEMHEDWII